jgi:hypothetical protein
LHLNHHVNRSPSAPQLPTRSCLPSSNIEQVEYRMSTPTAEQPSIPFTFVTFNVERVIRGRADGSRLTLRFHGGLFPDGRFLDDPTAPLFDVGERSILLVSGNGTLDVPLVGFRFGRLRVIGDRIYDDFGKPLAIVSRDRVKFGRSARFDEISEHRLGATGRSFNPRVRELASIGSADLAGPGVAKSPRPADDAAGLDAAIGWLRALRVNPDERPALSVNPDAPFAAPARPAVARTR